MTNHDLPFAALFIIRIDLSTHRTDTEPSCLPDCIDICTNKNEFFPSKTISKPDSLDWKDYGCDSIIHTVTNHKHLGNGSIILMHNGAKYTKDALEQMIIELKNQGYEFVKVSELIYTEDYQMDHEGRQYVEGLSSPPQANVTPTPGGELKIY